MTTNRNEVEGNTRKGIGIVKEKLGRLVGHRKLEEQGAAEQTAGGFQAGVGKVTRKVTEAIDDTARDLSKP
ncbi:MAG TPA: CsbD family protein [Thermoanaerobaculia bacterium]|jgi:uncharacterized protein YjbJ (UPF0337 family)